MDRKMIEDKLVTLDESRKWVIQAYETMKEAQTDLYDTMQALNHLVNEHKLAYDNAHDQKLAESDRIDAYNDAVKIREQCNETLDKWFDKYGKIYF